MPDTLSEYAFAGLLRGNKTEVVKCLSNDLEVPASAEIVLEGYIEPGEMAPEGPYGDHTGYYNEIDQFRCSPSPTSPSAATRSTTRPTPAARRMSRRSRRGAERSVRADPAKQFPEIVDFYLPPEGCSYRPAVVTMKNSTPATLNA